MSEYLNELQRKIDAMPISKDSYSSWLDNECTQRFFAEIKRDLQDHRESHLPASSIEQAGMAAIDRNATIDVLESVLEWKPSELEADE